MPDTDVMTEKIPATCRAAALVTPGDPLELVELPIPTDVEPGALIVRSTVATVCATDVHLWEGTVRSKADNSNLPYILGHEMTGRVAYIPPGAERDSVGEPLTVGDRIVWTHGFCGSCYQCAVAHEPTLCTNRRGYMATSYTEYPYLTGGFSEYGYVFPTSGRLKVPDGISDAAASASSCALRTVMHAFARLGDIEGKRVVIQGSGPLGLFALARTVTKGAESVLVIGGPADRLALAGRWGADSVLDVTKITAAAARVEAVREWTGGRGAEVVIEVSGAPSAFAEGVGMLGPSGRMLLVGGVSPSLREFDASQIIHKQATIIGSLSGSVEDYYRALRFMAAHSGRFGWDEMITTRFRLDDINLAIEGMHALREIKPAIEFGPMTR